MGLILDLLTLPMLGAPRLASWLGNKIAEEVNRESLNAGDIRGELLELQQRYDTGAVGEQDYDMQEAVLMERLKTIREAQAQSRRAT